MAESNPLPLAPGDDDPKSPAAAVEVRAAPALGPGDDDPRSPAKGAAVVVGGPLAPGAGDDANDLVMLTPGPAGPGDAASGPRQLTHVPRRPSLVASASVEIPAPVPHEEIP